MAHSGRPIKCNPKAEAIRSDIAFDRFETVKQTLQELGIDVTDGHGRTALMNAAIENKIEFIVWLLENQANINQQDQIGYSILHFAAQNKKAELVAYFLEKGANPNLRDIHGNTALWTAVMNSRNSPEGQKIIDLLLKYGTESETKNNYGKSPKELFQLMFGTEIYSPHRSK